MCMCGYNTRLCLCARADIIIQVETGVERKVKISSMLVYIIL